VEGGASAPLRGGHGFPPTDNYTDGVNKNGRGFPPVDSYTPGCEQHLGSQPFSLRKVLGGLRSKFIQAIATRFLRG